MIDPKIIKVGISRRDFLKISATGTAAIFGAQAGLLSAHTSPAQNIKIGVQLYSVRKDCAEDFDKALDQIAVMGFEGVEFAGYYQYTTAPMALKKRLDDLSLKAAGTHIGISTLKGDTLLKTLEFHKIIGCNYLIVPSGHDFTHPEKSKTLAEVFNKAAAVLKAEGMYCGFHNHENEFNLFEGETYWDLFAKRTHKDVVLQLDVGWAVAAQVDPVAAIRKHPGRSRTVHFKPTVLADDTDKTAIIGQDSVDWPEVIKACYDVGGTEWFTIEQEYYPGGKSPMECTQLSLEGLKNILPVGRT